MELGLDDGIVLELILGKIEGFKLGLNEGIKVGFTNCLEVIREGVG